MGLAQLNCSEIRLKRVNHRHGILGTDRLFAFLSSEWSQDITKNQLPSLLGGNLLNYLLLISFCCERFETKFSHCAEFKIKISIRGVWLGCAMIVIVEVEGYVTGSCVKYDDISYEIFR